MPLLGRKILITGGTRALGRAMAAEFARRRAQVCLTGRKEGAAIEAAAAVTEDIGPHPDDDIPPVSGLACEVTDEASVQRCVDTSVAYMDGLTDVVANAGAGGRFGRFDHLTSEEWKRTFSVNLFGTYHTFRACLEPIKKSGGGTLVGVSGYGAVRPLPFLSPYSSSKAAVIQLVGVLAKEFEHQPLRFLTFSPGILDRGLTRNPRLVAEDAHHFTNAYATALRKNLRKPIGEAAKLAATLVDPATPIPSGHKVSLHKPFEVTWAMARATMRAWKK